MPAAPKKPTGGDPPPVHPLVKALNPDPTKPPVRALKLFGLPGESPSADQTRLWLDDGLTSYVDVPNDSILYSNTLPDDAGTIVWVAPDAALTYGSVTSHEAQAEFLTGAIATTHLVGATGAAPGFGGPVPTPPVSLFPSQCGPCASVALACPPSLPICPSEAMAPSHCGPCATRFGPCLSLPFCPSEAMAPSHCGPCPTRFGPCHSLPFCPTETCPPSHLGVCPTHPPGCPVLSQIWVCWPTRFGGCPPPTLGGTCPPPTFGGCPSVHVLCPTPTAVTCPSHVTCPSQAAVACPSANVAVCPSRICPSVAVPCHTGPACPPVSLGCPEGGGGFGPAA